MELLLCAEVESEHRLVPLVGVLERRHKCEFRAGERGCKLCVPAMFGVLVEQGEIGCVRRLVHERTSLRYARLILCAAFLVLALRSGNLRVGVGVVCLHTEVAYVLYHVNLEAHVLRVAQVGGHVVGVCSGADFAVRRNEHLFYRVFQILVEDACENLLCARREPLPAQVDIVDAGAFQLRVSLLLILLALYLVGHNLVESRSVDRTVVREAHVHLLCRCPLH